MPSVDRVITSPEGMVLAERYGRAVLVDAVRAVLADQRAQMASGGAAQSADAFAVIAEATARIDSLMRPSLRPVFNLTGTVLHTNLGRALYPQAAIDAVKSAVNAAAGIAFL